MRFFSLLICALCGAAHADGTLSVAKTSATAETVCVFSEQNGGRAAVSKSAAASAGGITNTQTFSQIETKGLDNGCYPDVDYYLAEYLHQHPETCLWDVDPERQTISTLPVPSIPADAIRLPTPSGKDDTAALERIINQNEGRAVFGSGTYRVNNLKVKVPVDIFNMPMRPTENAGIVVTINSADVRVFNSPIDAHGSSIASIGYRVNNGADRFVLINSGFSNIHHKQGANAAGVYIKGANDFFITCNQFENIINDTDDKTVTARANAIWMNGSDTENTSGGIIANNLATELQSNGKIKDAEFFTIQNYRETDSSNPIRFYANRGINAGKRMTKLQESNALILSNYYEWRDKRGPLGDRLLFAMVNVQFSDNIIARNNRFKVAADGRFDYIFHTNAKWPDVEQTGIHFDSNDIEIQDKLNVSSGNVSKIITARNDSLPDATTGKEASESSASYNVIHGKGDVSFYYWFGPGYDNKGGGFETIGNVFKVPFLDREYRVK